MANLLTDIQGKVLTLLEPLISSFADYDVNQVTVADISTIEDLDELIERFRDIMPGAFLSIPRVTYGTNPNGYRVVDATLQYGLLVGITGRWEEAVRQDYIREVHDRFAQHLFLRQIPRPGIVCSNIDFLRPDSWEYRSDLDKTITAFYLTFSVGVRNWQINEPE